MAKHIKTAKVNRHMFFVSFLFCLTLISIHLTSGLYARYISSAPISDFARVVTFGDLTLTETGDFNADGKLVIIPGVNLTKKVVVDFAGSEAATYVFAEVTAIKWQATDNSTFSIYSDDKVLMQWSIADGWSYLTNLNGTYVYYRALAPNTKIAAADIIADDGKIIVSDQITTDEIKSMTGISIKLRAAGVQSGGFNSPEAAWNSIAAKEGSVNE